MEASEVKDLEDVFNSFDSDKSGAIDLQEIKNVASALGSELTDEEMRSIIKNLDSNGDGKISFEEFKFWWEHGHKGSLGKLVYLKAKSMKLTKKWLGQLQQNGVSLQSLKESQKINEMNFQVSMEGQTHQKMQIQAQFHHNSEEGKIKINQLNEKFGSFDAKLLNIIIVFGTQDGDRAKVEIQSILNSIFASEFMPMKIDLYNNDYLRLKITPGNSQLVISIEIQKKLLDLLHDPLTQINNVTSQLGSDLFTSVYLDFSTNFSIDDLLEKNLLEALTQGFTFKAKCKVPEALVMKGREILQAMIQKVQEKRFQTLFSLLLKNLSIKLKLRSPEMIHNFFQKLGIKQLLTDCPNLSELLEQISLFGDILDLKSNESDPKHFFYRFLKFLNTYTVNDFQIHLHHQDFFISTHIRLPGYLKLFKILFNQL